MQTNRASGRRLNSISPLLPFYLLGLLPEQTLWPAIFLPLILAVNFGWALVMVTALVVLLGETERVGQRILLRYAVWATVSGLIINIGHEITLVWLSQRVDFLLEAQPWRLVGLSYVVPGVLLFLYHWLLSWQYLRLRWWRAAIMGLTFAVLTAPWTTLVIIDFGQGRMPPSAQRVLWIGIVLAAAAVALFALATTLIRRGRSAGRFGRGLAVAVLAVALAVGGARVWLSAVETSAIGLVTVTNTGGDLAFATRGRVYGVSGNKTQVYSLGRLKGQVIAWSPNGRLLLVNEQRSDGKGGVAVISADGAQASLAVGAGEAGVGAWSPDSTSIVYVTPTEASGEIHVVRSDGSADRIIAEGRSASWSPDGRRIVYGARTAGRWQIWVILPNGTDAIQLTSDGGEHPAWSPDGRYIAYILNNRVQIMDADGANKRRLPVDNSYVDVQPVLSWASDGTRLAYVYVFPAESGRATQLYIWETSMSAVPVSGGLITISTPTVTSSKGLNRSGEFRAPFAWSSDGAWFGFVRGSDLWTLNVRSGEERKMVPAESFAWGGKPTTLVVRPVPTYPPTPTPTALPPTVVESPSVLVLAPKDPATIFAATAAGVIRKVGAGGWFLSNTGINYPTRVRTLVFDPVDSAVMYAGTDGQRAVAGALYKSVDGGVRWTATGLKDVDIYTVAIEPHQPSRLYAGTSKGVYASSDGGATWSQRNSGLKTTTAVALVIDASQASSRATPTAAGPTLYLGTKQGEVYKSSNGGAEWRLLQTLNAPITNLVVYNRRPVTVFASTEDGLFTSTDSGETWNQVSGGIWKVNLSGVVISPKDNTVYAYGVRGVYVSHDGGANWGPAGGGLEETQPSALVSHPTDGAMLYVGTDKGVYRTSNGGVTWLR